MKKGTHQTHFSLEPRSAPPGGRSTEPHEWMLLESNSAGRQNRGSPNAYAHRSSSTVRSAGASAAGVRQFRAKKHQKRRTYIKPGVRSVQRRRENYLKSLRQTGAKSAAPVLSPNASTNNSPGLGLPAAGVENVPPAGMISPEKVLTADPRRFRPAHGEAAEGRTSRNHELPSSSPTPVLRVMTGENSARSLQQVTLGVHEKYSFERTLHSVIRHAPSGGGNSQPRKVNSGGGSLSHVNAGTVETPSSTNMLTSPHRIDSPHGRPMSTSSPGWEAEVDELLKWTEDLHGEDPLESSFGFLNSPAPGNSQVK